MVIGEHRIRKPWGYYYIIEETSFTKEKKIIIYKNERLSLQQHENRDENWTILQGNAEVILNNKKIKLSKNDNIFIPRKAIHRVKNIGNIDLIIKEIQIGNYLKEHDIVRFEDDYGRL